MPAAFEIGGAHLGPLQQLAAGAGQRDLAVDHDIAAVRELQRMEGVLLDQEHGEAVLRVEVADGAENLLRDQRREAERGLVEQQQARAAHQRAADRQHLLLAAGQRAAALAHALLQQREQREDALRGRRRNRRRWVGDGRAHLQVFQHAHAREDAPAFRRLRDAQPRDLVRRQCGDVAAVEQRSGPARARGLPKIVIISVDLPAPLAPISVTISPSLTSRSTPFSA